MSEAARFEGGASGPQRGDRGVFSSRLSSFLDQLVDGETPNSGSFCSFCYNPLPVGFTRCDHCGQALADRPAIKSIPQEVIDMQRRMRRRESLIVNSFAYFGLALGFALFLGLVAVNVLLLDRALWFFLLATFIFLVGSRVLAGIFGGFIGDEVGYRYAHRRLAEDWRSHVAQRETARQE
jgi:hypothetical protein